MPDSNGFLLPSERRILLQRYAPVLVLFPERADQAPYPDDGDAIYTLRGSFHPRAAEFFLKYARVRYRRKLLFRNPGLLFKPRTYQEEIESIQQAITRDDLKTALEEYRHDPRFSGLGDAEFRAAMRQRLVQRGLARRMRGLDLLHFRGHNLRQWKSYFEFLQETDPATRRAAVYGRLVQGLAPMNAEQAPPELTLSHAWRYGPHDVKRNRVALQYWFQYYYDDWANRHEGDWESITILLELDPAAIAQTGEMEERALLESVAGRDVGYSSHEDGYRRIWDDVQRTREGRPIVYVARGSSASYFAWRLDGYPTSARVGVIEKILALPGMLLRGRRFLGRRWDAEFRARFTGRDPKNTDWVAADPDPFDRLENGEGAGPGNLLERMVPAACHGVRRRPDFGPQAGQDGETYHLETDDLFWLEMVQEFGVMWGEDFFLPGTKGPSGVSKARREAQREAIRQLSKLEAVIEEALDRLSGVRVVPGDAIPELDRALRPLRPAYLKRQNCFPNSVRSYVRTMWAAVLRSHPEAWPGGPGLFTRWTFSRQPRLDPLLEREDPLYHLKSLLAQVRRTRYETQQDGSKWDNPFAWARYICRADTFYYGIVPRPAPDQFDLNSLDCGEER